MFALKGLLSTISKIALRSRYLQYRGSRVVYLVLKALGTLYKALFAFCNDVIVPTVWSTRFRLPKAQSFAEGRYITIMLGFVEPQWRDFFDKYIAKAMIFVDIGAASDAYYTIRACKLNPRIRVIAIEPIPTEYRYMLWNVHLNSCLRNVISLNVALSSIEGDAVMLGNKVRATTLDNVVEELHLPCVDVIKIDVEGMGAEVLKGALKTITKCRPAIFFEVHNKEEILALRNLIEELKYRAVRSYGDMYLLIP